MFAENCQTAVAQISQKEEFSSVEQLFDVFYFLPTLRLKDCI